ncbi:MAG: STAS-like domain-containing protein [Candidatus Neomarinimicrobiota bacterium]
MNSSNQIKNFILDNLSQHQKDIIQEAIVRFGISRQAVHRHMNSLIVDKKVAAYGNTKGRHYELIPAVNFNKTINVSSYSTPEHLLKKIILPHLKSLSKNIYEIFEFSISALLNNVYDHADASKIYFKIFITRDITHFILSDNGIGIFDNISNELKLSNTKIAALHLATGNVTADSSKYSGEELNTVILLFDSVTVDANGKGLKYSHDKQDWSISDSTQKQGTRIHLQIDTASDRTCANVFNKIFINEKDSIRIPLRLINTSEQMIVSRKNQAKSILRNIEDYKKIEFDFNQIQLIGPAFADQLIRKTREKNQSADIKWINSNETVDLLMSRALARQS